jgi:hypothetical protein
VTEYKYLTWKRGHLGKREYNRLKVISTPFCASVLLITKGRPTYKHCPNLICIFQTFLNWNVHGLCSFTSIANQKSVRYSVSISYFTNIAVQNVNKVHACAQELMVIIFKVYSVSAINYSLLLDCEQSLYFPSFYCFPDLLRLNAREMAERGGVFLSSPPLSAISSAFSLSPGNNKTKENRGIACSLACYIFIFQENFL